MCAGIIIFLCCLWLIGLLVAYLEQRRKAK